MNSYKCPCRALVVRGSSINSVRHAFMAQELNRLEQLLERIALVSRDKEKISLGEIIEAVGSRSFGPLLLTAGVISVSPLSGIPGMPTAMGTLVLLIGVQLLFRRSYFWLPHWLLKRTVTHAKIVKTLKWIVPPARFIDRWLRPRLTMLVQNGGSYLIAVVCILVALTMPVMELVPFAATSAGFVVSLCGLALIARDGLLALIAILFTIALFAAATYGLF